MRTSCVLVCIPCLLAALLVLAPVNSHAQVPTAAAASISGTVTDQTGAVVAGAQVVLASAEAGIVHRTETNAAGRYVFVSVLPGNYTVTVNSQGFRQVVVQDLKLEVTKSYTVDVALQVGAVAETVEVSADAVAELQTTDASVGNVIESNRLTNLPNVSRDVSSYFELQPGVIPRRSANTGGAITGSRSDQATWQLDGTDVSDNNQGRLGGSLARVEPAIPVPAESIEMFRVSVTNPNATFGRAGGGQFTLVTKRGTNDFHGSVYWYHQNDNLNANTWDRNRRGQDKPEMKDNRYGFSVGGPILHDKTFFFFNYEARRFPRVEDFSRIVPTQSLRAGVLTFPDASGNPVNYDLATSTLCGNGTQPCDPRGIGLNPMVVQAIWAAMPAGNDPSLGDGLNTTGFRDLVDTSLETNYYVLRLDHAISDKWRIESRFSYAWTDETISTPLDLRGGPGNVVSLGGEPSWLRHGVAGLIGQITPSVLNEFRFGWTKPFWKIDRPSPFPLVPGSNISVDLALVDEPVDSWPRNRLQWYDEETFQFIDNVTWSKGSHTIQAGGNIRLMEFTNTRNDKFSAFSATVGQLQEGTFFSVPAANRPPTCGGAVTTSCLTPGDIGTWGDLYAGVLGIVESVSVMAVRDGNLDALPLGTSLINDTTMEAYEFYANDTWRINRSVTLSYGLMYQWQAPVEEDLGRQTFLVNNDNCDPSNLASCELFTRDSYVEAKRQAALAGQTFNPEIGYVPVRLAGRESIYETDWSNWSPRVALAWNPSMQGGFLGKLLGDRKTVLRGGYSLVYDRMNTVSTVIVPMLGVGFTQNVSVLGPTNSSGEPFRIGVDGPAPIPAVPSTSAPIVPPTTFSELLGFQIDPDLEVPRNHSLNFTIQRQLPGNMVLEVGWAGRYGRRLIHSYDFNSLPYFHTDPASGQTLAQAIDLVATALRGGADPASLPPVPWFENQVGAGATQQLAASDTNNFINGQLTNLGSSIDGIRIANGLAPINNRQILSLLFRAGVGESNYNALLFTLRKRQSYGLVFDLNYTFSRSLDQGGVVQNSGGSYASAFDRDLEYGPSSFDLTHVMNVSWVYDLPLGRGRSVSTGNWADKLVSGWHVSGILGASSGLPLNASFGSQAFGGGPIFTANSGAIPLSDPSTFTGGNNVHSGVAGSGGVGTTGDPAAGGSGLNLFQDPALAANSFRHILVSQDSRTGRGVLRGLPHWNLDLSLGKRTEVNEKVRVAFSFDFFNILNRVEFNDPSLRLDRRSSFGVLTSQFSPVNRTDGSRGIQFGLRVEF